MVLGCLEQVDMVSRAPNFMLHLNCLRNGNICEESLWQSRFKTDAWQYQFIKQMNHVRKSHQIGAGASEALKMRLFKWRRNSV